MRRFTTLSMTSMGLLLLLGPAADLHAQCSNSRPFGGGGMAPRIVIDTTPFADNDLQRARIWEFGHNHNNTGSALPSQGSCPSDGTGSAVAWWQQSNPNHTPPPLRWINGALAATGCTLPSCIPGGGSLTVLVEDQTADETDAGFIVYTVDETTVAGSPKRYDHARTGTGAATTFHSMVPYPTVEFVSISGEPPNLIVNYNDVGAGAHTVCCGTTDLLPASRIIDSYDIMSAPSDVGRDRSLWTFVKSVPYADAAILGDKLSVPCPNGTNGDTRVAVGLTFDGLPSEYVGRASMIFSCDPNDSGDDGGDVPASSDIGVMVLVVLLLGTGAYALLRRRRSAT